MRQFITIIETALQSKPTKTLDPKIMSTVPAVDTADALVSGSREVANTELGRKATDLAPSIMRDLEGMVAANPDLTDGEGDGYAYGYTDIPRTPENLPMVLSNELGLDGFNPKWHMVGNLPGMLLENTPNQAMARAAKKGLDLRKKFKRGGTEVGVARARDLSNKRDLSDDTVKRMHSYFSRHEVDKKGKGFGDDSNPSAGYIAWLLWGGDAGQKWAAARAEKLKSKTLNEGVRMVGRLLFGRFTNLPIEQIQMMTTAFRMNHESDVRKMFSLIRQHGHKLDELNYDFSETMPAYAELAGKTDAQLWSAFGYEFLLMRDNGGHYVYAWPATSSKITTKADLPQIGID